MSGKAKMQKSLQAAGAYPPARAHSQPQWSSSSNLRDAAGCILRRLRASQR